MNTAMNRRVPQKCREFLNLLKNCWLVTKDSALWSWSVLTFALSSGVPRNFVGGGGSTNSVEDRENRDLGAVAP